MVSDSHQDPNPIDQRQTRKYKRKCKSVSCVNDTIFTSLQEQCSASDLVTEFPCELRRGVRALFCIGSTKPTRKGKEVSSAIHRRAARARLHHHRGRSEEAAFHCP